MLNNSNSTQGNTLNNKTTKYLLWVLLIFILIYLIPLGGRPLVIPDETRYAEVSREMVKSGDWVVPRINGLRYFEKPPMGYWLNAISIKALGENSFSVRLSSALSVLLTGSLVFLLTTTAGFGRKAAFISTLIYISSLGVYASGTFSVLDAMLTLFLTAGIGLFYIAAVKNKTVYWILSGVAFGCAFLTKGFLAFAVPVIVLIPWLIWTRQTPLILKRGWLIIISAFLVALPWAISIHNNEPDFWNYFFWNEHVRRFTSGNAQHTAPFYYFIMYFPLLAFPWATFLPAAIKGLIHKKEINNDSLIKLSYLWVIIPFLFFSASSGKLATYILPIFPPLAILLGVGLYKCAGHSNKLINIALIINVFIISIILLALVLSKTISSVTDIYSYEYTKYAAYLVALSLGIALSFFAFKTRKYNLKLNYMLLIIFPFLFVFNLGIPEYSYRIKSPGPLLEQHKDLSTEDTIVITSGSLVRAVSWYFKREDLYLYSKSEVSYGLDYEDSSHKYTDTQELIKLVTQNIHKKPILLVCHKLCMPELEVLFKDITIEKYVYGRFILIYIPLSQNINQLNSTK